MFMGTGAENFGDIEWTDPISGLPVRDGSLEAKIHNQVPGVVGRKIAFSPLVEGSREDGTSVYAFFMHDSNGQPLVGMHEIPIRLDTDSRRF